MDRQKQPRAKPRQALAFTLVELMTVVAVAGLLATMGFASTSNIIAAERGRNEAVRFSMEMRRQRSEAMQQQMYSLVAITPTTGGVRVTYSAERLGTATQTPCELMDTSTTPPVTSTIYRGVSIVGTSQGTPIRTLCLTPHGQPISRDLLNPEPSDFDVLVGTDTKLTLSIDRLGSITSTDQPNATGIAQTSLYPLDLMATESAPVPPNQIDLVVGAVYEVAPNDFVDADGAPVGDPLLGGGDDPCSYDPAYCDPCVLDPTLCDPCVIDPASCVIIP